MKQYLVIALGFLLGPLVTAQDVIYTFDAPCITTCNNPGPDCPGVGTPLPSFINNSVFGSASTFDISTPFLTLGTSSCILPVFTTSMNGFASGNPGNPSRARWASGWTTALTASANQYYRVLLSAATFTDLTIVQIAFDESRSGTGPRMCQVMVSVDGGPFTLLWMQAIPDNTSWRNRSITTFTSIAPMPTFNNTLEIRFQGYSSELTNGSWRIDNVRIFAGIVNLPIELLSFTGEAQDRDVRLDWSTATETDNDYFTVMRSSDLTDWQEVARVDGAGNSISRIDYSLLDVHPTVGINYYYLKQTDMGGTSSSSRVVAVNTQGGESSFSCKAGSLFSWDNAGTQSQVLGVDGRTVLSYATQHTLWTPGTYFLQLQDRSSKRLTITP